MTDSQPKHVRRPALGPVITLASLLALFGGFSHASPADVCKLASQRTGLIKFAVPIDPDHAGNRVISADIDRDGAVDQLKWFDPGSGSIIPADYSIATLTLASRGQGFKLEQQRLHVVKIELSYYVVTAWVDSEQGPWHREVFAVTSKGFSKVCSFSGQGLGH